MKIVEQRFLRGPNVYSARPCCLAVLDLEELDNVSSAEIPGFTERLCELIPTLHEHRCSPGYPGGFVERLHEGTYMAHVVEHVTIELQCLAGTEVSFGRARMVPGAPGRYRIVFAYRLEKVAQQALFLALDTVNMLAKGVMPDLSRQLDSLRDLAEKHGLGPSTRAIVEAARERGIPTLRLTDEANLFQLGWGSRQKRIQATVTSNTSNIAVNIASDKQLTKALLQEAGVPVPNGQVVTSPDEAVLAARRLGTAVTVKPLDANQGKGVSTSLRDDEDIRRAFEHASLYSRQVIVEQHIEGDDYRILVAGGRIAAAARRRPASVTGDGMHTIRQLVDLENANPTRGNHHSSPLTRIRLDEHAITILAQQGLDPDSIPPARAIVTLRGNANLSTGGSAEDVTDQLHPRTAEICIRAASRIGLDIAGIDLICTDISRPLSEQKGAVVEVNAAPGIRMHEFPSKGLRRGAGAAIVDALFAPDHNGRIPLIAVTGTNGKTTTTLMIGLALQLSGLRTGVTTTQGVYVNGRCIREGDCTGYWSARSLLTAPDVDAAVLETARGGIVRRGLAFDLCDVGVVLNVSADHLGQDGISTIEELARVKEVVALSAARAVVLNADDERCVAMAAHRMKGAELVFFSMTPTNQVVTRHLHQGGRALLLEGMDIVLAHGDQRQHLVAADSIPCTMRGHARHNIANALAASAALNAAGLDNALIVQALTSFISDPAQNPLRLNVFSVRGATVIVDYAHNAAAYKAITAMGRSFAPRKLIGVVAAPGDRQDKDLLEIGYVCGSGFDEVIVYEMTDRRGRRPGETAGLLMQGARSADCSALSCELEVRKAVVLGLSRCAAGDLLIFGCASYLEDFVEAVRQLDAACADQITRSILMNGGSLHHPAQVSHS